MNSGFSKRESIGVRPSMNSRRVLSKSDSGQRLLFNSVFMPIINPDYRHKERIILIKSLSITITCSSVIRTRALIHPALNMRCSRSLRLEFASSLASRLRRDVRFRGNLVERADFDEVFLIGRTGILSRGRSMLASNTKGFAKNAKQHDKGAPDFPDLSAS